MRVCELANATRPVRKCDTVLNGLISLLVVMFE